MNLYKYILESYIHSDNTEINKIRSRLASLASKKSRMKKNGADLSQINDEITELKRKEKELLNPQDPQGTTQDPQGTTQDPQGTTQDPQGTTQDPQGTTQNTTKFTGLLGRLNKGGMQDTIIKINNNKLTDEIVNSIIIYTGYDDVKPEYENMIYGLNLGIWHGILNSYYNKNKYTTPAEFNHKQYFDITLEGSSNKTLTINLLKDFEVLSQFPIISVALPFENMDNLFSNGTITSLKSNSGITSSIIYYIRQSSTNNFEKSDKELPINNIKNIECTYIFSLPQFNIASKFTFHNKNIKLNAGPIKKFNGWYGGKKVTFSNKLKGGIVTCLMDPLGTHCITGNILFKNTTIMFNNPNGTLLLASFEFNQNNPELTSEFISNTINFAGLKTNANTLVFTYAYKKLFTDLIPEYARYNVYYDNLDLTNVTVSTADLKRVIINLPDTIEHIYYIFNIYIKKQTESRFKPLYLKKINNKTWQCSSFSIF